MSMLGGAFGVLLGVLSAIDPELISFASRVPGYASIKSLTTDANIVYPYLKIVLYGFSFAGALLMFMLRKRGYMMYAIAQSLLLIIPYLTWNKEPVVTFFTDLPDMIFTIAFIAAYALYLPEMGKSQETEAIGAEK